MKVTVDDFRKRYAEMSDEGLLELNRNDLVDLARECFDEEVARRRLHYSPTTPATAREPRPMADPDDRYSGQEPVSVGVFSYPAPGKLARSMLRAASIPCFLEDEHLANLYSPLATARGGLRLMVPPAFEERAREVLAEVPSPETTAQSGSGEVVHRMIETNGIRMHIAEAGVGPLVVLLHGFPETWYSWRHQLSALAAEGYRVVAPDLRGYGQTDRPEAPEAYDIFQLTADIAGLIDTLDGAPAVLVGHDWGAWIVPYCAMLRPDLVRAVALLSVPFVPRRDVNESQWEERKYPGKMFYQAMLRSPMAEAYCQSDVRARLLSAFWTLSGDAPEESRWQPAWDRDVPRIPPPVPEVLPPWLTEEDVATVAAEFERTGFSGPLQYYRNMDRNWALTPFLDGAKLLHRTLFLAGAEDPVLGFLNEELAGLEEHVPNLWQQILVPGAGHWIQQECPDAVNDALLEFLSEIAAGERGGRH